MQARRLRTVKVIFALFFVVCSLMLFSHKAHAASWSSPVVSATTQIASNESYQDSAVNMTVNVKGMPLTYSASVTKGLHIWLARYTDTQTYRSYWAVKSPYDQYFVNLTGVPNDLISLVPGTDTLTWDQYTGNYNFGGLVTTRDGWKALQLSFADGKPYYSLDPSRAKQWFIYKDYNNNQTQLRVTSRAISSNGRYVLAWIGYDYYVRLDLDTNAIQYIGRFSGAWYGGPAYNPYAGAITSDGRYVFIYGGPQVVDVNGCGVALAESQVVEGVNTTTLQGCSTVRLSDAVQEKVGYAGYDSGYHWSDDGESLVFFINPFPYTTGSGGPATKVTLRLTSEATSTLDYLALGDSYSSGEGDIDSNGQSVHYIHNTGYDGGCHLSDRSYPFLLRDYYSIPTRRMQSVACSGARVMPDYDSPQSNYLGQGSRLKGYSGEVRVANQKSALSGFTPGYIPQIEFIKKYNPAIITLTGGGNDIGFADILTYCATPEMVGFIPIPYTCDYAKKGTTLALLLDDTIRSQYFYNKRLIENIKSVDSGASIILVGYPSFITAGTAICGWNAGDLDSDERAMIERALTKTNQMLQDVAHDTSVSYVDIQDSLEGGRLCEGSKYMTGLYATGVNGEAKGPFHPNSAGQAKIAKRIEESGVMSSVSIPDTTGQLHQADSIASSANILDTTSIIRGESITGSTNQYMFQSGSTAKATIYSDEILLGNITAQLDGSINFTFNSSLLPIGRHVLVLEGVSYTGEKIQLFQFLEIRATNRDLDGDGLPDKLDKCSYVAHVLDDDGRDVCAGQLVSYQDRVATNESKDTYATIKEGLGVGDVSTQSIEPKTVSSKTNDDKLWWFIIMITVGMVVTGGVYAFKYR